MTLLTRAGFLVFCLLFSSSNTSAQTPEAPAYVGSQTCSGCHETEAAAWQGSHHAKAWMEPSEASVDGDFENAEFTHRGRTTRFFHNENGYFIETSDIQDGPKTFKVVGVGGVAPLQQYLIETEPGRMQSLDVAWDQEKGNWYHVYPDQVLKPEDGFHWSGPYKNWNARCAECHATGFEKNYSPRTRTYQSTQAEIGVGCEACHGPGEAHVAWAEMSGAEAESPFPGLSERGLLVEFTKGLPETEIQQCAGCHSRREPFQDGNPMPGTPYHDSYRMALLRNGLYHADGQILDEVYVYGSFLQSKMHEKGVTCTNCHEPHGATLRAEGNGVCTQCHSPASNSEFPSLTAKLYDDPSHHFHETGSEGAQCASCHMIERTYMGIDGRRDHSFRVPRPDLSAKIGTPNACNDCHEDKTAAWAAAELETRFPDSGHRGPHFGVTFDAARKGTSGLGKDLLAIATQESFPAIVRASALDLLSTQANADLANQAAPLLDDDHPLVRAAAIKLQETVPESERLERVLRALEDPVKSVRVEAARQLLGLRRSPIPESSIEATRKASREWQATLAAKADFPETHMAIGGTALVLRNPAAAISAFREVTRLDPQLVQAWSFLVRLHLSQRDLAAAEFTLQKGLAVNPGDPNLEELKRQFPGR
ncbi:decaheme c-type cytochrome, DmsE family [Roseibium album]|nr:decaheme c-type cytochrome, DmsE family [Roseibium album]